MVDQPSLKIEASFVNDHDDDYEVGKSEILAEPYWRQRIEHAIDQWHTNHSGKISPIRSIQLKQAPAPHVGLGSGTQLACCVVELLNRSIGQSLLDRKMSFRNENANALRLLEAESGRGKRSHIGMGGFLFGGCIIDHGQTSNRSRIEQVEFPNDWRFVLWCDHSYRGDSGDEETQVFRKCEGEPNPFRDSMNKEAESLRQALQLGDWNAAGQAIGLFGTMAGEIFRPMQGGIYRSASIAAKIDLLRFLGFHGVGQSSWGPTIYALTKDEDHARWLIDQIAPQIGAGHSVIVAKVAPAANYSL